MKKVLRIFLFFSFFFPLTSFAYEAVTEVPYQNMYEDITQKVTERAQADFDGICFLGNKNLKRCRETLEVLNLMSNEKVFVSARCVENQYCSNSGSKFGTLLRSKVYVYQE